MTVIDKLIRSKRKTVAIEIRPDGRLVVRAPKLATQAQIEAVLEKHQAWITKQQEEARRWFTLYAPRQFIDGEMFWFLGERYILQYSESQNESVRLQGECLCVRCASDKRIAAVLEVWYRQQARRIFQERLDEYAHRFGFVYQNMRLSSARTRWGSCSSKGSLNFTWRLVMAPISVIDYVIVHELCHLLEANHSQKFWALVAQVLPDYKARRKWLKENGRLFHWT